MPAKVNGNISMDKESNTAKENPLIKSFVQLVDETVGDGVLDFSDLKAAPFLKYWKHLFIYKYEENINDFRVVFFGTHLVEMEGTDWTGTLMSEMNYAEALDEIHDLNMKIINGERRVFANGTIFWNKREYRNWHQVKMPLQRNGIMNEVLICMEIS